MTHWIEKSFLIDPLTTNNAIYCASLILSKHFWFDYIRFLWFKDIFSENPQITVYHFLRVVFGLICSSFLLNAIVKHHASKYFTKWKYFVDKCLRDLFVDDSTSGFDTVFTAYDFYLKAKSMVHDAGFDLRKWAWNSSELMNKIKMNET